MLAQEVKRQESKSASGVMMKIFCFAMYTNMKKSKSLILYISLTLGIDGDNIN